MTQTAPRRALRVGFLPLGPDDWHAATTHLVNWLQALHAAGAADITPVLLAPSANLEAAVGAEACGRFEILRRIEGTLRPGRFSPAALAQRILGIDARATRLYAAAQVPLIIGNAITRRPRGRTVVSWIPDLQHLHLPQLFSPADLAHRDWAFRRSLEVSARVVVTSRSVQQDLARFQPRSATRVVVLRPAAQPPRECSSVAEVVARYRLPERFFYLPNHFWLHKNHRLVVEAVSILADRGAPVVVAATGIADDYRSPDHATRLLAEVGERGLTDCFRYLGVLPRSEVAALMRQAVAVINPSRFEGWAYGVDEAAALGRPLILSDIATHHEHESTDTVFFPTEDPGALASCLASAWATFPPGPSPDRERLAANMARSRLTTLGLRLADVIRQSLGSTGDEA